LIGTEGNRKPRIRHWKKGPAPLSEEGKVAPATLFVQARRGRKIFRELRGKKGEGYGEHRAV